ncbi:MAG: HipA domain-containing protein [Solirubrobacteraceae bacterium]|nr:HipA domain-containing protein [Solirubrobacteraceae bacterium]
MTEQLSVWLGGAEVARLQRRGAYDVRCRYSEDAVRAWPQNSPVISCSLPLGARALPANPYCRGLLPEGQALQVLAREANLPVTATFELLARYGRDIAGALVIAAEPPDPAQFGVEPYDEDDLVAAVRDLEAHPLGAHDDSELSLAGLQDKLLLVDLGDGGWGRPLHGQPSTHILKVDDARYPGLVVAEAQCLAAARAAGLTTIDADILMLEDVPCLVVSRFDRTSDGTEIQRIHQEDLCQALGIDHEANRGRAKYERSGGPTFRQAAELLDRYARDPAAELDQLVRAAVFTVLIGNADAHGKNLALLHPTPQTVTLAPLYDTVPTMLWPKLRREAAMSIGGSLDLTAITLDDILREARSWAHPADRAEAVARETIERVTGSLGTAIVDPRLVELVEQQAARLR